MSGPPSRVVRWGRRVRGKGGGERRRRRSARLALAPALGLVLLLALGLPTVVAAQIDAPPRMAGLVELSRLIGDWRGEIDGTIGAATGARRYRSIMNDGFLLMRHDRDPHGASGGDEDYEEWSIFSLDPERRRIVLREFFVEGMVTRYECDVDADPLRLTCEGEAVERGAGLSLRLQYLFADRDHFTEVFEVFGANGDREVRMQGSWTREGPS